MSESDALVEKVSDIIANMRTEADYNSDEIAREVTPLILERAAEVMEQTVPAEFEVEQAMNGDFETRKMALAVRLVCGKIVKQKIDVIRSLATSATPPQSHSG
jgi:hypothetical protein